MGTISTDKNVISFTGDFGESDLQVATAAIYQITNKLYYKDIVLDFSKISKAIAPDFLPLCANVRSILHDGIDTQFIEPDDIKLRRLFRNAGWSHLLDPVSFAESDFAGKIHSPAAIYRTGEEQHKAVDNIIDILLGSLEGVTRSQIAALEWSINEITDNVLNHAESSIGGIVQVTSRRGGKMVEFVVCDYGLGIPRTLRSTHSEITSDIDALDRAIREGITRNTATNMGNGLYGSYRMAQLSGGQFKIQSGYATLKYDPKIGMHIRQNKVPFHGTLVSCSIDCSDQSILEEALVFRGKIYKPSYTYFDKIDDLEKVTIKLLDESNAFGTREIAKPVRLKIENVLRNSDTFIDIDMDGVELISSSFADEVFGKLFYALGPLNFTQRVRIVNGSRVVSQLIDRAISQRMALRPGEVV
ncbi:DUF4325 domain-containing protein [Mesorhizobium sp. M7A.F.Ca.MR.362.00.0.0]|uniref:STAS-like domain-containing protein n=1 Tax=Mesorhizobium sp. M7A.F.Ca.MR.362.00.0.0 TaxID=2496779 RepID=UPI000FD42BC1|nr:DUF4325 domain-containing protein [Mesorhizobium sp. M7A.F.Ca.MR.362.00.0.0]RUU77272.1 DUF4325 domain-containing protein [Mesorhizobium sp. M7A.F.Ca.MR.362.00.0.0]RWN87845.1 MAG: DUF4325 domain-containing protein [Mesorhizobium sp.]